MPLDAVLASPALQGASVGACVTTRDGRTVYRHNAGLRLTPGSNEKLVSCSYALHTLGPDYRTSTRFWKRGDTLVIGAPGDPLLTHEQLQQAAKTLGIDYAKVQVREAYHPGYPGSWEWDDLPNRYAAPVVSLCFDQGAFELWSNQGQPELVPGSFGIGVAYQQAATKVKSTYDPIRGTLQIVGQLPSTKQRIERFALPRPDEAAASLFGKSFERIAEVPTDKPDLVIESKPLRETVKACLQPSDNLIAENLLMIATTREKTFADPYEQARQGETRFLTEVVGIPKRDFEVDDGSGESRHNMVTARMLAKLLRWADKQPTRQVWRQALATPGVGTLQNRLIGLQFQGKTGTLDMSVALSGYIRTRSGRTLVASVIVNNFSSSANQIRSIVDRFMGLVAKSD